MKSLSIEPTTNTGAKRSINGVTRVMSFTSGKGGVGKTNLVVNVGIALARLGRSVLILDADLSLANVDVLLGQRPAGRLTDVVFGDKSLTEIIVRDPNGIDIIPAATGAPEFCNLRPADRLRLMRAVEEVASHYDYLLIDTGAGIGPEVMHFNSASAEIVCVINSDPASLTDAYALIKVLSQNYGEKSISVVANNVQAFDRAVGEEAKKAFDRLARAVERFLHVDLKYLGFVPADGSVCEAMRNQRAVLELFPSSPAGLAIAGLARRIDEEFQAYKVKGGMQFFFEQLLEMNIHGA